MPADPITTINESIRELEAISDSTPSLGDSERSRLTEWAKTRTKNRYFLKIGDGQPEPFEAAYTPEIEQTNYFHHRLRDLGIPEAQARSMEKVIGQTAQNLPSIANAMLAPEESNVRFCAYPNNSSMTLHYDRSKPNQIKIILCTEGAYAHDEHLIGIDETGTAHTTDLDLTKLPDQSGSKATATIIATFDSDSEQTSLGYESHKIHYPWEDVKDKLLAQTAEKATTIRDTPPKDIPLQSDAVVALNWDDILAWEPKALAIVETYETNEERSASITSACSMLPLKLAQTLCHPVAKLTNKILMLEAEVEALDKEVTAKRATCHYQRLALEHFKAKALDTIANEQMLQGLEQTLSSVIETHDTEHHQWLEKDKELKTHTQALNDALADFELHQKTYEKVLNSDVDSVDCIETYLGPARDICCRLSEEAFTPMPETTAMSAEDMLEPAIQAYKAADTINKSLYHEELKRTMRNIYDEKGLVFLETICADIAKKTGVSQHKQYPLVRRHETNTQTAINEILEKIHKEQREKDTITEDTALMNELIVKVSNLILEAQQLLPDEDASLSKETVEQLSKTYLPLFQTGDIQKHAAEFINHISVDSTPIDDQAITENGGATATTTQATNDNPPGDSAHSIHASLGGYAGGGAAAFRISKKDREQLDAIYTPDSEDEAWLAENDVGPTAVDEKDDFVVWPSIRFEPSQDKPGKPSSSDDDHEKGHSDNEPPPSP